MLLLLSIASSSFVKLLFFAMKTLSGGLLIFDMYGFFVMQLGRAQK